MASEIARPHVLANFKPSRTEREKVKRGRPAEKRREREGNSEVHLAAIRKLPCIATLKMPAGEAHHLKVGTGERGAGMRSSDRWAVPVTRDAHEQIERAGSRNEHAVLAQWGITDPLGLARALWEASPNVAKMTKIVLAHTGPTCGHSNPASRRHLL